MKIPVLAKEAGASESTIFTRSFGHEKNVCSLDSPTPYAGAETGEERNLSGAFGRFRER